MFYYTFHGILVMISLEFTQMMDILTVCNSQCDKKQNVYWYFTSYALQ